MLCADSVNVCDQCSYDCEGDQDEMWQHKKTTDHDMQMEATRKWLYECSVCDITLDGHDSYVSHMTGKKHRRKKNESNVK